MRKLASIAVISSVSPIENSDFLDVVQMRGKCWNIVVKRGTLHVGSLVVFFEIDSALPADDERYAFLRERCLKQFKIADEVLFECLRLRTVKLRGVVSQGLVLPLSDFPELQDDPSEGRDVTEILGVLHFEDLRQKYQPKQIPGDQAGDFPYWLEKTDEERIQNLGDMFTQESYKNMVFEVTEKYDGCSATYFYAPEYRNGMNPFGVCSRNYELKETAANVYWEIARRYEIEQKLRDWHNAAGHSLAIQGEIVGPGINHNRDKYKNYEFYVFRIFDISATHWLNMFDCQEVTKKLNLNHVKVINSGMRVFQELPNIEAMLAFVEGKTDHGNEREGMVFKLFNNAVHFKCINNKYLLSEKD